MRGSSGRASASSGAAVLLFALSLAACGPDAGGEARPGSANDAPGPRSVVLVTVDTLRADALGAYGSPLGATPNLDRIADEGVLFEQVQAVSPNTLPSHASILTGKRPFRHGVRSNVAYTLGDEQLTLAEKLGEAGYATGAEVAAVVLGKRTGIAQGFEHFRDTDSDDVELAPTLPGLDPELALSLATRGAADITARGVEFMERNAGEPFFLWLHYYDPHWPYTAPEPFASRLRLRGEGTAVPQGLLPELIPARQHAYPAEVAYVDEQLGVLVEAMRRRGLDANTLLVITSDHGESLGEHGEDTHAHFIYQSTLRVPLLFWGPSELPGSHRVARPVRSVDIAPTVLDWLGVAPLDDIDGQSLLPLLSGPEERSRVAYSESIELTRLFGAPVLRSLREGRWKYLHKPRPALYDLEADPGEQRDLAAVHPDEVLRLREQMRALLEAAGPAPAAARSELDAETAAQLAALGYATGGPSADVIDEIEAFEAEGPDAADMAADVRLITRTSLEKSDPEASLEDLRGVAQRHPRSLPVLGKLLDAQLALGRAEEALATLRRGLEMDPDSERYWSNLAELLVKMGRIEEAMAVLPGLLERFPCDLRARTQLANLHARAGDHAARIALLDEGLSGCAEAPELINDLAYALATAPDSALRDGPRALELALRAARTLDGNPLVLDTVAVAQAENGQLDAALATLQRAIRLAREQKLPPAAIALLGEHEARIGSGVPVRE